MSIERSKRNASSRRSNFSWIAFAARSAVYDEVEAKSRADAAAKGIKFLTADAKLVDDLRRLGAPQEQAWIDSAQQMGVDGKAALETYRTEAQRNAR